jgi:hypothetical protein
MPARRAGKVRPRNPDLKPKGEAEAFLAGAWTPVTSSNVAAAMYSEPDRTLTIEYKDGPVWAYDPVSPAQALAFIRAGSKGAWLWDNIKVRGSQTRHQCRARRLM